MKYKFKKWHIITTIVLLVLMATNPSVKRFKEFRGADSYDGLRRTHNFWLFSIYKDRYHVYIGAVWNFFYKGEDYSD